MDNIHLLYLLPAAATTLISFALLLYWKAKRRLTLYALAYSFVAYFLAIGSKIIFQEFTYKALLAVTPSNLVIGAYFGLQTMLLEVGLAYVFARIAISAKTMGVKDAAGYGISLAFWENGVFLGIFSMINLIAVYALLSHTGGTVASQVYNSVMASNPKLFAAPQMSVLLPNILYSVMERTSSILVHFSWGVLVVLAAALRRRKYFFMALPMGLVDFLVPFAKLLTIPVFESAVLAFSIVCLMAAIYALRKEGIKINTRQ